MEQELERRRNRIGFIGVGRMGSALLQGMIKSGLISAHMAFAYDVDSSKQKEVEGVGASWGDIQEIAGTCTIIVLAVKPKDMKKVLVELQSRVSKEQLVVSVAAGVSIEFVQWIVGAGVPVARVMPNAGVLVGKGACGFSVSGNVSDKQVDFLRRFLGTVGYVAHVPETAMDAVTGLSGSGPAYVYRFIEALSAGGVAAGLSAETAKLLAIHTVAGAAQVVAATTNSIDELVFSVATPGGTTAEGLKVLEEGDFPRVVVDAVLAAAARSKSIQQGLESNVQH